VKLNLKVGIFISYNTDLWLTDASYSGFGTDLDVIPVNNSSVYPIIIYIKTNLWVYMTKSCVVSSVC
jgi:hypothetical protein